MEVWIRRAISWNCSEEFQPQAILWKSPNLSQGTLVLARIITRYQAVSDKQPRYGTGVSFSATWGRVLFEPRFGSYAFPKIPPTR